MKLKNLVATQLPDYIQEIYADENGKTLFVEFLKAYYDWAEQTGNHQWWISNAPGVLDPDTVFSEEAMELFRDYYFNQFLPGIPKNVAMDKALLIKHGRDFYINKSNEQSFRFLFRALYNEDINIFIPNRHVITLSDKKKGKLIPTNKLQDSFYWQKFSYEITSERPLSEYREIIQNLIHPAGFKFFGRFLTEIQVKKVLTGYVELLNRLVVDSILTYRSFEMEFLFTSIGETHIPASGPFFNTLFSYNNFTFEESVLYIYAAHSKTFTSSTTEIALSRLGILLADDYLDGWMIYFNDGTGEGQITEITATENMSSYLKLTVDAVSIAPDSTTEFVLFKNLVGKIFKAEAGSGTSITLPATELDIDNIYNEVYDVEILYGTGAGQTKRIIDYDGTTKVATVESAWSTNPDDTSIAVLKLHGEDPIFVNNLEGIFVSDFYPENIGRNKNILEIELHHK